MAAEPPKHLQQAFGAMTSKPVAADTREGEDLGPCASRPMPMGWVGLYVLNGKEDTHAFQYQHIGKETFSADGQSFVIEWNIPEKWRLTVRGRNLWTIFVNVHHHKLEWIKKADRDFADGKQPIITGITVEQVAEEEK